MIKSSQHILKFSNTGKLKQLEQLFSDYAHDLQIYCDLIISNDLPLKINLSSKDLPTAGNIKHSQWKQIIYKNASEIIRSNIKFQQNKRYKKYKRIYAYFKKAGRQSNFTSKRFSELNLKSIISYIKINIKDIGISIDNRLLSINDDSIHFNEFIGLKLPYFKDNKKRAVQINLPIKWHKHSLKFINWKRKNTFQLLKINENFYIKFIWQTEDPQLNENQKSLGIDIGYKKLIADSNGKFYGEELEEIYKKLANKSRGSKNHKDLLTYKKNKINETCNNFLNENEIGYLFVENLKNVKKNSTYHKKFNNKLQYWSYSQTITSLQLKCKEHGIILEKVSPAYTSQLCSKCGTIDKENRKGEIYQCSCGNLIDADTNAAINILHRGVYNPSNTKE